MGLTLNIKINEDYLQTHVPNSFIDKYLPHAEPIYSIIYIYLLRYSALKKETDISELAKTFDITEAKCEKALKYWEQEGLLQLDENKNDKQEAYENPNGVAVNNRPSYTSDELEAYKQQEVINDLFEFAQEKLGRMLRYNDLNFLFGLYDWLKLDINVIKKLIDYCVENSHTNISYIEAVALDWAERNIKTVEDAEDYIFTFTKTYREILKAFGQANRNPIPKEIEYMEKWLNELHMPVDIILEACDKTIMTIGKPNFKYANTIIECWHKANVKTIDDIIKLEEAFTNDIKHENEAADKTKSRKKSKFANFEGRKIDYNEIEKLEYEYINSIVKGK